MRYASLGKNPPKRHVQVRQDGASSPLLVEEVMGYEGFSGNESILLHLQSPCRLDEIGGFRIPKRAIVGVSTSEARAPPATISTDDRHPMM